MRQVSQNQRPLKTQRASVNMPQRLSAIATVLSRANIDNLKVHDSQHLYMNKSDYLHTNAREVKTNIKASLNEVRSVGAMTDNFKRPKRKKQEIVCVKTNKTALNDISGDRVQSVDYNVDCALSEVRTYGSKSVLDLAPRNIPSLSVSAPSVEVMNSMSVIHRTAVIHPTAVIDPTAVIGEGTRVGAYAFIGSDVVIGDNVVIHNHASIANHTQIGSYSEVFPFAAVGYAPQDKKFDPLQICRTIIGSHTIIREHVSIHGGTCVDTPTTIGDHVLVMSNSHIAHDCKISDNVVISTGAGIAGHVEIDSFAIIGGMSGVHQFVRIGRYAIIGGMSGIVRDVLPYSNVAERNTSSKYGVNLVGMRRHMFSLRQIDVAYACHDILRNTDKTFEERLSMLQIALDSNSLTIKGEIFSDGDLSCLRDILEFTKCTSKRGLGF